MNTLSDQFEHGLQLRFVLGARKLSNYFETRSIEKKLRIGVVVYKFVAFAVYNLWDQTKSIERIWLIDILVLLSCIILLGFAYFHLFWGIPGVFPIRVYERHGITTDVTVHVKSVIQADWVWAVQHPSAAS